MSHSDVLALVGAVLLWFGSMVLTVLFSWKDLPDDVDHLTPDERDELRRWLTPRAQIAYWWAMIAVGLWIGAVAGAPVQVAVAYVLFMEVLMEIILRSPPGPPVVFPPNPSRILR